MRPGFAIQPGSMIAGKYRVERLLGQGGMGMVALADHVALSQKVAIKILTMASDAQARARFQREARAAVQLKSDHVTKVFDVGATEDGTPYMVMEYLAGRDLSAVLVERGPLPVGEVAEYILQTCEALGEAHRMGIVHRDIKPANLFLTYRPDGRPLVKVLDFGISKIAGSTADMALTRTQAVLGSPLYMSPEQLRATRDADHRSDIWSLGVVMFELLAGRVPFLASAITELAIRVVQEPAPHVGSIRADVPEGIARILMRCLEKAPDARYQSVTDLAADLEPFAAPMEQVSRADRVARMSGAPDRTSSRVAMGRTSVAWGDTQVEKTQAPKPRAVWPFVLLGSALVVGSVSGVGAFLVHRHNAQKPVLPDDRKQLPPMAPPSATVAITSADVPEAPQAPSSLPTNRMLAQAGSAASAGVPVATAAGKPGRVGPRPPPSVAPPATARPPSTGTPSSSGLPDERH